MQLHDGRHRTVGVSRITQTVSECEENILYFVVSCKCCFDPWSTLNWFQMINFARSSQWVQKLFFFSSSFMTITFKSQLPKYIIIWCVNKLLHNVSPYERILTASLGSGKAFIYLKQQANIFIEGSIDIPFPAGNCFCDFAGFYSASSIRCLPLVIWKYLMKNKYFYFFCRWHPWPIYWHQHSKHGRDGILDPQISNQLCDIKAWTQLTASIFSHISYHLINI